MDKAKDYSGLSPSWRGYIDALKEDVQAAERRAEAAEAAIWAVRNIVVDHPALDRLDKDSGHE